MPPILIYFFAGLTAALVAGIVCYYVVGFSATPLLRNLFGERAGNMWGRLFRMSVVSIALIGALSIKFYGCHGPTDYSSVAGDHSLMFSTMTEQISGSLAYSASYLVAAAAIGAIAFGIYHAGRAKKT